MTDDRYAVWDGAYVLGALSSADRREFESHLLDCDRCSVSVAELRGLPGLLGRLPREIALTEPDALPTPAPGGGDRLVATIRARHNRTRLRDAIIAVAATVAVAVSVGFLVQRNDPREGVALHPMADVVPTVIDARAGLTPHPWGTTVSVECSYRRAGPGQIDRYGTETDEYELTVTDWTGRVTQLATWIGTPGATVTPQASTSVDAASIRTIDIRATDTGAILLTTRP